MSGGPVGGGDRLEVASDVARHVVYRPARAGDYQAVLDLEKNFFVGMDYLPATFLKWLKTERFYLYVAEHNDKVIAFQAKYVSPDGRSYTTMSARVMQAYRQTGVHKGLIEYSLADLRRKHPELQRMVFSSTYGKMWKERPPVDLNLKGTLVRFLTMFAYTPTRGTLETGLRHMSRDAGGSVAVVSPDVKELGHLFENPEKFLEIIDKEKKGIFISGFAAMPLLVDVANLKEAAATSRLAVSYRDELGAGPEALSLCGAMDCMGVVRVELTIYARDAASCIAHIRNQLGHVIATTQLDNFNILIYFEDVSLKCQLEELLTSCFGERFPYGPEDIQEGLMGSQILNHKNKL